MKQLSSYELNNLSKADLAAMVLQGSVKSWACCQKQKFCRNPQWSRQNIGIGDKKDGVYHPL